jgi:hypothetical protein
MFSVCLRTPHVIGCDCEIDIQLGKLTALPIYWIFLFCLSLTRKDKNKTWKKAKEDEEQDAKYANGEKQNTDKKGMYEEI